MAQLQKIFNKILVLQNDICMIIGLKSRDSIRDNFKGLGIFTDYVLESSVTLSCTKQTRALTTL